MRNLDFASFFLSKLEKCAITIIEKRIPQFQMTVPWLQTTVPPFQITFATILYNSSAITNNHFRFQITVPQFWITVPRFQLSAIMQIFFHILPKKKAESWIQKIWEVFMSKYRIKHKNVFQCQCNFKTMKTLYARDTTMMETVEVKILF